MAEDRQLSQLIDMKDPEKVLGEVRHIFILCYPLSYFDEIERTFRDFCDLMDGRYPGYRSCNTRYHDKIHTTDALLAISRLIDGYNSRHEPFPAGPVRIAHMATILHDSGYIQTEDDTSGTGAKYTLGHVERSVVFMEKYLTARGYSEGETAMAGNMVRCTGVKTDILSVKFGDHVERTLGLMLGAADLIGQMASRTYLERLVLLYNEFLEGKVGDYTSLYDFFQKTVRFYVDARERFRTDFENVTAYALCHFQQRYGIDKDLYEEAILREISYLNQVLKDGPESYLAGLRRRI